MTEDRKVINLRTRDAYEAPEVVETLVEGDQPTVDGHAVELLEKTLEDARAGHIHGVVLLCGMKNAKGDVDFVASRLSETVMDAEQMFLGATLEVPDAMSMLLEIEAFGED